MIPLHFCVFDGRTTATKEDRLFREQHWKKLDFDHARVEGVTLVVPCGCGVEHRIATDSPPAEPHRDEGRTWFWRQPNDGDMTERKPVDDLVRRYRESVRDVTRAFELLDASEERMQTSLRRNEKRTFDRPRLSDVLDQLKRSTWEEIAARLEVRRLLSMARAAELDKRLDSGELPEPTLTTIADFGAFYQEQAGEMVRERVREVFDLLRPPGSRYKTNTEFEIGPRVVLSWMIEHGWSHPFRVRYGSGYGASPRAQLLALETTFQMLDGRGTVAKTNNGLLVDAINGCGKDGRGATEYFAFRACKNGSLHLTMKRLDLLAKLNRIAGGKNLKPGEAA
ncbi:MAG: DUF4942 domain-containing protein [Polyangiaceae bacterium]|nr:DUF4942 domain-containing protein [Polyangiaceae bacterium]